jgi:hypothetical protein
MDELHSVPKTPLYVSIEKFSMDKGRGVTQPGSNNESIMNTYEQKETSRLTLVVKSSLQEKDFVPLKLKKTVSFHTDIEKIKYFEPHAGEAVVKRKKDCMMM